MQTARSSARWLLTAAGAAALVAGLVGCQRGADIVPVAVAQQPQPPAPPASPASSVPSFPAASGPASAPPSSPIR